MIITADIQIIKSKNEKFLTKGIKVKTPKIPPKIALNIVVFFNNNGFIFYLTYLHKQACYN